jgi:hypothetical protein
LNLTPLSFSADVTTPKIYLLGTINSQPAILHLQKPAFDVVNVHDIFSSNDDGASGHIGVRNADGRGVSELKVENLGDNDIVSFFSCRLHRLIPPLISTDLMFFLLYLKKKNHLHMAHLHRHATSRAIDIVPWNFAV